MKLRSHSTAPSPAVLRLFGLAPRTLLVLMVALALLVAGLLLNAGSRPVLVGFGLLVVGLRLSLVLASELRGTVLPGQRPQRRVQPRARPQIAQPRRSRPARRCPDASRLQNWSWLEGGYGEHRNSFDSRY
jgi:hypothetical protein